MFSHVSLQRSCGHVLGSVMESKAAPTQSSCPSGTDRFFLHHSWHFVPGYSHESLRDNKSPLRSKIRQTSSHPGALFRKQLCNLHCVQGSPFQKLIAANPESQPVVPSRVHPESTYLALIFSRR